VRAVGEFANDRQGFLDLHVYFPSFVGLCPGEWYEFQKKISVTNEHRRILFPGMRTEAA
jgi:hypothetical protein